MKQRLLHIPAILIVILAAVLRLQNLGYSDYQGDETKAFFLPDQGQSATDFLFDQRKGPMQFGITLLMKLITPDYSNEFLVRLPFALAGTLAVLVFYKLVRLYFNRQIAVFSTFFMATNGFLIGLSRIAQYQAYVILFMLLALYFFTKAVKDERWAVKGLYLGFISWALSILSHYDGVFIGFLVLYLAFTWGKRYFKTPKFKHAVISGVLFVVLLSAFYLPYLLHFDASTWSYWEGRISGSVSGKVSSSMYLFKVYQPIYVLQIYIILAGLCGAGLLSWLLAKKYKKFSYLTVDGFTLPAYFPIFLWLLPPLIFMESISVPGTHIYSYLLPLSIFVGSGISYVYQLIDKLFSFRILYAAFYTSVAVVFAFIYAQSYAIFVNNYYEYPWENEQFLVWTLPKPSPIFHLSIFGFPYNRGWEQIREILHSDPEIKAWSCNERAALSRYYINLEKNVDKAGYLVYILNPQTFTNSLSEKKAAYWVSKYTPVYTFSRNGRDTVYIYKMEPGTREELMSRGI